MRKTEFSEGPELRPEQQEIVDDGLRILARMIARRFIQDSSTADANTAESPDEESQPGVGDGGDK
ncbi:MAG: hypothetical protein F4X20_00700 [Dehalococcoidia bacterium]|nr:hypothetical protein [Dehalococcoidia bacterium]